MRRISLESTQPGMILAKAILGSSGNVLLKAGIEVKPQYIVYLRELGIGHLYVRDSRIEDVESKDVVSEETRHEARLLVKKTLKALQSPAAQKKGIMIQDKDIIETASKIVNELLDNREMVFQLDDIRACADYLFAHSVNCSILSTLVATKIGHNVKNLKYLAVGALLHDIGMVAIPEQILNKSGELTEDEYATVKNHPVYGYELFKKTSLFSARSGAVILQHHERFQGQGYPYGTSGDKITPLAQILSIVDVYDALVSDRPFRKAFQPHQAVEMLLSWGGEYFETDILNEFLSVVAAYPVGFHIILSNGESGLVVANNPGFTLRPIVRVLYTGEDLAPHPSPYDLDLSKCLDLTVTGVLD